MEQCSYLPLAEQYPRLLPLPQGDTADPNMPHQPIARPSQANKRASPDDWERIRPVVAELYINQNKSLPEVIRIIAHGHNHRGTPKMYKSRIERWGLDVKNNRLSDMYAILHQKRVRDAAGKRSKFKVRGRETKLEDVYRYFKRKGVLDSDLATTSVSKVPVTVEAFTPPPSPPPQMNSQSLQRMDQTVVYSVPHSPSPPQILLLPERLLFSIKAYFDELFGSRTFFVNSEGRLSHRNESTKDFFDVVDFTDYVIAGARLLKHGATEGRRLLSKACETLLRIIQNQQPRALDYILFALSSLRTSGYFEVAEFMLKYMGATARHLFVVQHPWGQLLVYLSTVQREELQFTIREAWHCTSDAFRSFLGTLQAESILCYSQYIRTQLEPSDAERLLEELIEVEEVSSEESNTLGSIISFDYMEYLYRQGRYAETMLQANEALKRNPRGQALELLAWCHYQLNQRAEAEMAMRSAIKFCSNKYGEANPKPLKYMDYLRNWYREWDRESEAEALDSEISRLIEPDEIDLECQIIEE